MPSFMDKGLLESVISKARQECTYLVNILCFYSDRCSHPGTKIEYRAKSIQEDNFDMFFCLPKVSAATFYSMVPRTRGQ